MAPTQWGREKGDISPSSKNWLWHRKGSHAKADNHWHQKKGRVAACSGAAISLVSLECPSKQLIAVTARQSCGKGQCVSP